VAIIYDMGTTGEGLFYVMVQDAAGEPRALLGTPDVFEEFARDLLDMVEREYCLPHVCDHLEMEDRRS
jgi:hypothetical protein